MSWPSQLWGEETVASVYMEIRGQVYLLGSLGHFPCGHLTDALGGGGARNGLFEGD